jgi:hypothetical protein
VRHVGPLRCADELIETGHPGRLPSCPTRGPKCERPRAGAFAPASAASFGVAALDDAVRSVPDYRAGVNTARRFERS